MGRDTFSEGKPGVLGENGWRPVTGSCLSSPWSSVWIIFLVMFEKIGRFCEKYLSWTGRSGGGRYVHSSQRDLICLAQCPV